MNRILSRISIPIFTIFLLLNAANAIDNEYKNSLTKIELTKTSENSYNVNLYTSKKFSEPVKIIKKSDLNYYILLPETKNSATLTSFNTSDIRNVDAKVFQYAGADINNGYTKININTTKPLNFKVAIKNNAQAASKLTDEVASNSQKITPKASTITQTTNNQKKNVAFQKAKIKENLSESTNKTKTAKNENKSKTVKSTTITTQKKETIKKIEKTNIQTPKINNQNQEIKKENPIESNKTEEIQEKTSENETNLETENTNSIEKYTENELLADENQNIKEPKKDLYDYLIATKSKLSSIKQKIFAYKISFKNKLKEYGLSIRDILLMALAGIISFIIMLLILTRKTPQPRLKNKADLIEKNEKSNLTFKKPDESSHQTPNNGQYFIFDKSVKQTGFCDPATSAIKRNYELSSYEPDLRDNYKRAEVEPYGTTKNSKVGTQESEYDIIQKILKEDSFIEITPRESEQIDLKTKEIKQSVTSPILKEEIKPQLQKQIPNEITKEPEVLSSVEIAPERGFMCVSYNDNINLLGYIFDDVFALHNFKTPKLENYNIKFRMSEKTDKTATFIVKVDKTKMLIKVTKSTMIKEVVM